MFEYTVRIYTLLLHHAVLHKFVNFTSRSTVLSLCFFLLHPVRYWDHRRATNTTDIPINVLKSYIYRYVFGKLNTVFSLIIQFNFYDLYFWHPPF